MLYKWFHYYHCVVRGCSTISNRLTFHRSEKVWYVCNIFLLISVDNNYVSFVVLALRLPPVVVQGCVRLQTALRSLWCEGCVCVHRLACVDRQHHLILILQCVCVTFCVVPNSPWRRCSNTTLLRGSRTALCGRMWTPCRHPHKIPRYLCVRGSPCLSFCAFCLLLLLFYHSDLHVRYVRYQASSQHSQGSLCPRFTLPVGSISAPTDMSVLHDILIFFLDVPFLYARSFWHWTSVLRLQNAVGMVQSSLVWLVS